AGHAHQLAQVGRRRRAGRPRPRDRRAQVDGHGGRPGLRLQLAAARDRRGVRRGRRASEVRARLRRGLDARHEPGPLRPRLRRAGARCPWPRAPAPALFQWPAMLKSRTSILVACLLVVYVVWGSTYLAIRIALEGVPPLLMGAIRNLVAGPL